LKTEKRENRKTDNRKSKIGKFASGNFAIGQTGDTRVVRPRIGVFVPTL
jgi:hypothetical protein